MLDFYRLYYILFNDVDYLTDWAIACACRSCE